MKKFNFPTHYLSLMAFLWMVLAGFSGNSQAPAYQKSISNLPHFEDFNSVSQPEIPEGWSVIVKSVNQNAFVRTASIANPVSPPNHVRFFNSTDLEASLYLVTPGIVPDIDQLRIRFFAKAHSGSDNVLEVGTMDVGEDEVFTMIESITLPLNYTDYVVSFADYTGDHEHIAFRVLPGGSSRSIYVDNFILEYIPTGPVAEANPFSWNFGAQQIGFTWAPKLFTITNVGVGTLQLQPSDISINGENADEFVLNNLETPVNLEPFETTEISVSFSPQTIGDKTAILNVGSTEVPLSGEGFDNSITEFPHFMDFNDVTPPTLPIGWISYVESHNTAARVETTNLVDPVTPPNQLRFVPMNDPNATLIFISPPIGAPINTLRVSFSALGLNSSANQAQVGSYSTENGFVLIESVNLTSSHQYYQVDLNAYEGENVLLAIKGVSDPATGRPTYLDNLNIDTIPQSPHASVAPDAWEFDPTHYGESSSEKQFTITNIGMGTLMLNASDITLEGADAADFTLNNLTETVELELNESTTIGVLFTPELEGDKEATLKVMDFEVALSGYSYNPNITELPYFQDFNNVNPPAMPIGWSFFKETTSGQATVQTSHLMNPFSEPYHIRFGNFIDADAELVLISPEIEFDINPLRASFYAKVNIAGGADLEVGTWNPADSSFTSLGSFTLTTDYTHYFFEFDEFDEIEESHLAFRPDFSATYRWVTMDNFTLDFAPIAALLNVTPDSYTFVPLQYGTVSAPKEFTMINDGGDTLVIAPTDITLTGVNADAFILYNLEEEVQLLAGETATFSVTFAPGAVGNKEASIMVHDFEVPLSGEAFDATITEFPWEEDFSELDTGEIPFGWIKDTQNWGASLTNNAGGQSPEMRFHFVPILSGALYLQSPQINSSDYDELLISFRHLVNNYQTPGIYTLKVVTIVDEQEYLIHEWVDPDNIAAESFSAIITAEDHGVGAENLRIAFVFDGNTEDINHWFIDDIVVREVPDYHTVTFNVMEDSPEQAPVEEVTVSIAGGGVIVTDENGQASITLEAGSYMAEIIKIGYENQGVNFTLDGADIEIDILFKDEIGEPFDLAITMEGLDAGEALLTWELETILHEFRYDDGQVDNQLGYSMGSINSILGAAHHYSAVLHEMSWYLTSEGGPHGVVKLWVLGLDNNGLPNRNDLLYTAENVSNVDNQWNTYQFNSPVEAPNGFYMGLSYGGFVGLAVDDGQGEPWEFVPGTHFGIFNIENHEYDFVEISDWDVERNFLLRANGDNLGSVYYDQVATTANTQGQPAPTTGESIPERVYAGSPVTLSGNTGKAFTGFNIYLDNMENPIAENVADQQYLFENLEPGEYIAGVQAVYSTGISEITTLEFTMEEEEPTFTLTFEIADQDGADIPDATITLNGSAHNEGVYVFTDMEAGTYDYTVSRDGFFDYTDQVTITDADVTVQVTLVADDVSVTNPATAGIRIFPNPASNRLTIAAAQPILEIRLIDLSGQTVYIDKPNAPQSEINVAGLNDGLYLVSIRTAEGNSVEKLQIVR